MLPGILFFCPLVLAGTPALDLAGELLAEGRWREAHREARRVLAAEPENERALLLAAMSGERAGVNASDYPALLGHLTAEAQDPAVRAMAAYEAGRAAWRAGDRVAAWSYYAQAFQGAVDRELFLRSGCALFLLRREQPALGVDQPALLDQLATCRNLWTWELRDEVRVTTSERTRLAARPAQWVVSFYRSQIGPAIGHRCSLHPSCSAYFLEASREHGFLGVPLIGDRLVREPGVVAAAEKPVETNGTIRFADPVSDHVRNAAKEVKP